MMNSIYGVEVTLAWVKMSLYPPIQLLVYKRIITCLKYVRKYWSIIPVF